jgi:hypothetical protein
MIRKHESLRFQFISRVCFLVDGIFQVSLDRRRTLSCGDLEIPPAFTRSLQETQPETHLNSSYVDFVLGFRAQMSEIQFYR